MTKERISILCKNLNAQNCTNIVDFLNVQKMSKTYYVALKQAGIIWKEDDYWRGMERIHDDRFFRFKKLQSEYHKGVTNKKQLTLFTKTKVKVEPKKEVKIEPKKVVSRRKPTLGIIQRFKVLFTGKI